MHIRFKSKIRRRSGKMNGVFAHRTGWVKRRRRKKMSSEWARIHYCSFSMSVLWAVAQRYLNMTIAIWIWRHFFLPPLFVVTVTITVYLIFFFCSSLPVSSSSSSSFFFIIQCYLSLSNYSNDSPNSPCQNRNKQTAFQLNSVSNVWKINCN